ncbi:MAG TPA: TMEM175 family protein [Phycisphaerae bacterium]|nr:TMEM175 family protein [Phycisphaerae bacterium]
MTISYNHLAGRSVERLAALSDGIFGVAMTLLLLQLQEPAKDLIHSEKQLLLALWALCPKLLVYLMSFITLSIFWVGQQTELNHLTRSERHLTWIHLLFLFAVTIVPFTTRLLTSFITYRTALLVYWANIVVLGVTLYIAWRRAESTGLVKEELSAEGRTVIRNRIIYAQIFYALGAMLCVVNNYWSFCFIILLQLNYAFAPHFSRPKK